MTGRLVAGAATKSRRRGTSVIDRWLSGPFSGPYRDTMDGLAGLDPDRPPIDVPQQRWEQFVRDACRFLNGPFRDTAASLGWDALDLFGCDRDRPFARINQAGLLWLLNGDQLIALSENVATIKTRSGARHTFRRNPESGGRVLAWELRDPITSPHRNAG